MAPMGGPSKSHPLVKLNSQLSASTTMDPNRRVKINVGGRIFETTLGTIHSAGRDSTLVQVVAAAISEGEPEIFFDRDPETFAMLLTILRTGKLDDFSDAVSGLEIPHPLAKLIREASYYGVLDHLQSALAPGFLDGADAERVKPVVPNGEDYPESLAASSDGTLWVGHGSKITVYDFALRKQKSTITELNTVQMMHRFSDSLAAVGADDFAGVHIYNVVEGVHVHSLTWVDKEDPRVYNATVRAITSSDTVVVASFESGQKLDNTLLLVDANTLELGREIGRQSGGTGHSKVATKLQWLPERKLLLAGSSEGGAFGYSGYIRLWDLRQEKIVWDWDEPHFRHSGVGQRDVFADLEANEELAGIFKVSINSGAVAMADLRKLDANDPWITYSETNPELEVVRGSPDNKLVTYNKQVFVGRDGNVEVWSEVPVADSFKDISEKEYWETSFRRNFVDYRKGSPSVVTNMAAGGNRLFVTRRGNQPVEVWETKSWK